jgi:DNA-binding MarR family transcriptional regulator
MNYDRPDRIHAVMDMIMRMNRAHHRVVERSLSQMDMHGGQHRLLMSLSRCEHMPTQKELAQRMDISPVTVANMLKKLEKGGYIARRVLDADGRCNEVEITERGHEVIERTRLMFSDIDQGMFEGFDDDEIERLRENMVRVNANLRAMEEEDGECVREDALPKDERMC